MIWLIAAGFAFQIGCIFALSSQIQRTMQLMMALVNSQNRILLERLDRLGGNNAVSDPPPPPPIERRVAQRRSPLAQAARSLASGDRRASPGRRIDDMVTATSATLRQAF